MKRQFQILFRALSRFTSFKYAVDRKRKEKEIQLFLRKLAAVTNLPIEARRHLRQLNLFLLTDKEFYELYRGIKKIEASGDLADVSKIMEKIKVISN